MGQVVAVTGLPMGDSGGPVSLDTHTGLLCFLDPPLCEAPGVHEMIRSSISHKVSFQQGKKGFDKLITATLSLPTRLL